MRESLKCSLFGVGETTMNIRLLISGLAACAILCAIPKTVCAKIFPKIFVTTQGGPTAASASPFGGNGTIDESDDFGQPQLLLQNLAGPFDIAVSDDIIYSVIGGKGIISAFSTSGNLINGDVATVPKGKPVGIASFGGNVFVANSQTNTIHGFTSAGGQPVLTIDSSKGVRHPTEITASGGNLFVVNQGTGSVHQYITEYNALTGQKIDGTIIQNLQGQVQIAVDETNLFVMHIGQGGARIDEVDLLTHDLTSFITGLPGSTDIAAFDGKLYVTDVPNHSIDVYDIATRDLVTQIAGLHGRPQGVDVVLGSSPSVPDQSATWLLLLLGLITTFGLKAIVRQPA